MRPVEEQRIDSPPAGKRFAAAAEIARRIRPEAIARGEAVLIGDRSGLVEWAGEAWTRLTGFPLAETLYKPISHFLDQAEFESEMIDLVAHHFIEGRTCRLALPFRSFDGRQLIVHLEVAPIPDACGEVERFVAVASELPAARAPRSKGEAHYRGIPRREAPLRVDAGADGRPDPIALLPHTTQRDQCALRALTSQALLRAEQRLPRIEHLETRLGDGTLQVEAEPGPLARAIDHLIQAATCDGTSNPLFVSVLVGLLPPGRSHHSEVHTIPVRSLANRLRPGVYLELHDTQPHLSRETLGRLREDLPSRTEREAHLRCALAIVRELGAELHLDSTPGCGNQSLLVFNQPEAWTSPTSCEHADTPRMKREHAP